MSPEIEELDKRIQALSKDKEKSDELRKKVNLVYDQVLGWSSKVVAKIDQQFGENISAYEQNKTLPFLFEKIAEAVCKQLHQIIQEEDDDERGYITAKDFMNDFATEEFLNKNIRVRPISGISRAADERATNNPYNQSMSDPYGKQENDPDQFNNMKIIEMQEDRHHIKAQKEAYMAKKRAEEEKLAKKRR